MKWTYRYCDAFRYIVTNETLVFGCPTREEAQHLANHLNSQDKLVLEVIRWWDDEEYDNTDLPIEALRESFK